MQSLFAPVLFHLPNRSLGVSLIDIQRQAYRKGEGTEPREEGLKRIVFGEQRTRKEENIETRKRRLSRGIVDLERRGESGVELRTEKSRKEKLGTEGRGRTQRCRVTRLGELVYVSCTKKEPKERRKQMGTCGIQKQNLGNQAKEKKQC